MLQAQGKGRCWQVAREGALDLWPDMGVCSMIVEVAPSEAAADLSLLVSCQLL